MTHSTIENSSTQELSTSLSDQKRQKRSKKSTEKSDVLVSAVISTYLLTHLHHALQRAEYGAAKEGRKYQAANFAELRKLLCMEARSMADASAQGVREKDLDQFPQPQATQNAA